MDLHYLKLFHAGASHLSLSRAAEELHISQPAVSIQIKKLEETLGMKLFERVGRQVCLTQSGEILYGYTTKIFDLVKQAREQIYSLNGTVWGNVQIGATNTPGIYIMPRILGKFKKLYPHVATNLSVSNGPEITDMIYRNQVDIAIMSGGPVRTEGLYVRKIYTDQAVLVVSPEHPLANRKKPILNTDLAGEVYVTQAQDSALYLLVERILDEMGLPFNISMSLGSTDAIKKAVSYNLGISFLPRIAVLEDLKFGLLREVKLKDRQWKYEYFLVYRQNKQFSKAVEILLKIGQEEADRMAKRRESDPS